MFVILENCKFICANYSVWNIHKENNNDEVEVKVLVNLLKNSNTSD